jgi:hypothetical protein
MKTENKTKVAQKTVGGSGSLFSSTIPPVKQTSPATVAVKSTQVPNITNREMMINISETPGEQIVLFGSDRQKEFGAQLDAILVELTKGTNPVLFEMLDKLSKGVEQVNIAELEKEIRESNQTGLLSKFAQMVGLSSAASRLRKIDEKIGSMLKSKSTGLLQICEDMQKTTNTEVLKLINDSKRLYQLSQGLQDNIVNFKKYVDAGKIALEQAKREHQQQESLALQSGDSMQIDEAKQFSDKINLFENRILVLETAVQKAPVNLEAIRIGLNASLSTLGETANSALEDFNDIKTDLIKMSVTHQIQTVQGLNEQRRKLKASLQAHANQQLGEVALKAAQSQGLNRLEDATNLLESAKQLTEINTKMKQECEQNKQKWELARTQLMEVKQLVSK